MIRLSQCGRAVAAAGVLALVSGIMATSTRAQVTAEMVTAFVGVNVVPMDRERILPDQTVLVQEDRIIEIGPAAEVSVPEGARRIEGRGKYLLPGLAEMHGHVPPPTAPARFTEDVLFLYLAGNVTTVRGMLGAPGQLELRERVRRGELLGPTMYLAGPSFSGQSINSPEQAVQRVREQKVEGWDLIKVHPGLTVEEYDAMARTAREVGIRFAGHVPADVGFVHAIRMGQETFDHLDGMIQHAGGGQERLDPARVEEVVGLARGANAWAVPTMALWDVLMGVAELETLRAYPELAYMPREMVAGWEEAHERRLANPDLDRAAARRMADHRIALLRALHEGGARILMGTDAPQQFSVPGLSLHRELRKMREAGMSPFEVLETGTRNVGEYFWNHDRFGMVAVGHRADLILLDANPLDDLANLSRRSGLMVRGHWLPEPEIQERLAAIAAANRATASR